MRFRAAFLSLISAALPALASATALPSDLAARIDAGVTDVLQRTGSPSASVAVVVGDRIVLAKGYGDARLGPALPATADTR